MIIKEDFFEDIADLLDLWVDSSVDVMTNEHADLAWVEHECSFRKLQNLFSMNAESYLNDDVKQVLSECFRGYIVSLLTSLDGGTSLAEKGRLYLVDEGGQRLGEGLHDGFITYLLDSGRLD